MPESVSTQSVVLLYQVHDAVTASHCLLQTPFRYCAHLLLLLCLLLLLSFFLSISVSSDGLQTDSRTPPRPLPSSNRPLLTCTHWPNLHQSDTKSHGVFSFVPHFLHTHPFPFICPWGVHTVFPTYMPSTMCGTCIVNPPTHPHTHTYTHTHTQIQAHEQTTTHRTSQLLQFFFCFFSLSGP